MTDGSSGEDDDQMDKKIWEIIAQKCRPYDHDKLSSLKLFVRLRQSIDHDQTFKRMLNKTRALVDGAEDLTFKEALAKTIEKEKRLIYQAFANTKEDKCESSNNGGDEGTANVWCLMFARD